MTIDKETPIDQMIEAFWDLCDEWWSFSARCDQWWGFRAACAHTPRQPDDKPGWWNAHSRYAHDLSTAIVKVYEQAAAVSHDQADP